MVDWAFLCGCSEGDRFVDIFNWAVKLLIILKEPEPGPKQRIMDKALVIRLCMALVFNVAVLFISLFGTENPHFLLVLFFAVCVIGYVIFVVLLSIKLWNVGFRAHYYIIHLGIYKVIEIFIQVCILILLSQGKGVFSGGLNTFFGAVSIIDIVLDFFQVIWFVHVHNDDKRIKPFHGEKNSEFCCIRSV